MSTVVGGRVTNATARALAKYCSSHACTQSEALRTALTLLSASTEDPEKTLATVATALGLKSDATPEDVQKALEDLVQALVASPSSPDGSDPLSQPADPQPVTQLSASAQRYIHNARAKGEIERRSARQLGISVQEFQLRKKNLLRRV